MYMYEQKLCTNKIRKRNHLIETDTELKKNDGISRQ